MVTDHLASMLLYYGQNAQVVHATGNYRCNRIPVHVITHARARGVYISRISRLFAFASSRVSLNSIRSCWEEHGSYMVVSEIIQRTGKLVSNNKL